ncbi:MAG: tetratricopeptide repeat protein [Myxococcota bacterium]
MQQLAVGLAITMLGLSVAGAQDETESHLDDAARSLFNAGQEAYAAGRLDEALTRFRSAFELSRRTELHYNIALVLDRLDRRDEALQEYESYLAANPEGEGAGRAGARAEVLRNGASTSAPPDATSSTSSSSSAAGPAIVLGVAGAALVSGVVAAIIARGRFQDAEDGCGETTAGCSASVRSEIDRASRTADISFAVAGAAALGGVLWLVLRNDEDADEARVSPAVAPTYAGLEVQGRF